MSSNLPEALEVYRAAWLILPKTEILIKEINAQELRLGLDCIMMYLEEFIWKQRKDPVILTSSETVYLKVHLYLDI